jgi:hypothetical protein
MPAAGAVARRHCAASLRGVIARRHCAASLRDAKTHVEKRHIG